LQALHTLASRLFLPSSDEPTHLIAEACQLATRAEGCAICALKPSLRVVAASGLITSTAVPPGLRNALGQLCEHALAERKSVRVADLQHAPNWVGDPNEMALLGCTSVFAAPIVHGEDSLGALILVFCTRFRVDEATSAFIHTACTLLGSSALLAIGDPKPDMALLEPKQRSTTGIVLLGPSVAHQLQGPVSALDLQLEEQRRLVTELRAVTDASDSVVWGTVSELSDLTDEIVAAVSRIRDTTQQLNQLGSRQRNREDIELSVVAREAVAILRPALEARGVVLEARLGSGGSVSIQRDAVLQVALDLITIAAELGEGESSCPHVAVNTSQEGERVILSVDDVGPALDALALRNIHDHPFSGAIPDERRRLVLRLAGDVAASHGGHLEVLTRETGGSSYRLVLPVLGTTNRNSSNFPHVSTNAEVPQANVHDVLIVDDDPIFSRSARRALRPHRVHESATASEAAFQLMQPRYTPSLVVCDLMLPGSDGTDLHARVRDVRPELARRFLFVTGGTLSKTTADYIRDSGCCAFQKPFDFSRLRKQLSRCTVEAIAADPIVSLQVHLLKPIHP
jgi:CheY-like chemotaxis protein